MTREKITKAIDNDYTVNFIVNDTVHNLKPKATEYFDRKTYYLIGKVIRIPNNKTNYDILNILLDDDSKIIKLILKKSCKCGYEYDCCDCGGVDCGCAYCWSCNACEDCLAD